MNIPIFAGKANYVYNGKYLLSATVRRDGLSYSVRITVMLLSLLSPLVWRIKEFCFYGRFYLSVLILNYVLAGEQTKCARSSERIYYHSVYNRLFWNILSYLGNGVVPCIPVIRELGLVILT